MKMKIVGHRGGAGLALENTLSALRAGILAGADYLEFDVRLTKDNQVILSHDETLERLTDDPRLIRNLSLHELHQIKLKNGEVMPLLADAIRLADKTPVIIEIKDDGMARLVLRIVDEFPDANVTIVSFKHREIALVKHLSPKTKAYVSSRTNPFDLAYVAQAIGADGLVLNFWILNPLTYYYCLNNHLDIMVYTIDSRFLAYFIHFFYPQVMICTNYPQYFVSKGK